MEADDAIAGRDMGDAVIEGAGSTARLDHCVAAGDHRHHFVESLRWTSLRARDNQPSARTFLRVGISAGVAVAAAAIMPGAANAAIVTLAFTLGTWALEFIAAGRGGILQQLASFTPS